VGLIGKFKICLARFNIESGKEVAAEIVGVVGNVCVNSVEDCAVEHIYLPESQNALRMTYLLVRTEGDAASIEKAVRQMVYLETPMTPLDDAKPLEERISYLTDAPKRAMWLLGVFAGLALLPSAIGIYGVSAYLATQRRREIGIRIALVAAFTDTAALVHRRSVLAAVGGLTVGLIAAAGLTRLLKTQLFGVAATDPATLLLSALVARSFATGGHWACAASRPERSGQCSPGRIGW